MFGLFFCFFENKPTLWAQPGSVNAAVHAPADFKKSRRSILVFFTELLLISSNVINRKLADSRCGDSLGTAKTNLRYFCGLKLLNSFVAD